MIRFNKAIKMYVGRGVVINSSLYSGTTVPFIDNLYIKKNDMPSKYF